MTPIQLDTDYLISLLADLVHVNSINPSISPDGAGEAQVGALLASAMQALGLEVTVDELALQRVNVVGIRRGAGGGQSMMWNAHMDTVGYNGMSDPFTPRISNGRLYGRGSQDMKGSLAAMLTAVKALNEASVQLSGDLLLTAVADEEFASLGTEDILRHYTADAAIVTEPTGMNLALAHRGFIICEVETTGHAAHGSRYQDGIDAILHMGRFLAELEQLGGELLTRPPHPLAGPPSLHASTIHGGSEVSTYPAKCLLELERRTSPGETVAGAIAEMQSLLDSLSADDPQFIAELRPVLWRNPLEVDPASTFVEVCSGALASVLGRPPELVGAPFWTDAALLSEAGIPSVVLGPLGAGLHSAEEWVDLESCAQLARVLASTALEFCGHA